MRLNWSDEPEPLPPVPAEPPPEVGDLRFVHRFLFWPRLLPLYGTKRRQLRWLEWTKVVQRYGYAGGEWVLVHLCWQDVAWCYGYRSHKDN